MLEKIVVWIRWSRSPWRRSLVMRPCQGKFRQATWLKKRRYRTPPPHRQASVMSRFFIFIFFTSNVIRSSSRSDIQHVACRNLPWHMCIYLDSNIVVKFIFSSYFGKKHDPLRTASAHVGRYHFISRFATCQSNIPGVLVTTTSRRGKIVKAIDKHRCIFGVVHLINSA